jgi:hypothetical protein
MSNWKLIKEEFKVNFENQFGFTNYSEQFKKLIWRHALKISNYPVDFDPIKIETCYEFFNTLINLFKYS